jgi:hypothetical protein
VIVVKIVQRFSIKAGIGVALAAVICLGIYQDRDNLGSVVTNELQSDTRTRPGSKTNYPWSVDNGAMTGWLVKAPAAHGPRLLRVHDQRESAAIRKESSPSPWTRHHRGVMRRPTHRRRGPTGGTAETISKCRIEISDATMPEERQVSGAFDLIPMT